MVLSDEEHDLFFDWLGLPRNFEKWECGGKMNAKKRIRALGMSKKALNTLISMFFKQNHKTKSTEQILNKMRYIDDRYKEVRDFLNSIREGLSTNDEKMAITSISEKVLQSPSTHERLREHYSTLYWRV